MKYLININWQTSVKAICQNIKNESKKRDEFAIEYINKVNWKLKTKNFDEEILKKYVFEVPVYYLSYWKNAVSAAYEKQVIDNKYGLPNGNEHNPFQFGLYGIEKWLRREIEARLQYIEYCARFNKIKN